MAPTIEHLLERTTEICLLGGQVSNKDTAQFLQEFSLDFIFSIFQSDSVRTEDIESITRALSYILSTPLGTSLVENLVPYGITALESNHLAVKQLAVEQLSRIVNSAVENDTYLSTIDALFNAFQTKQTELGVSASNALLMHLKNSDKLQFLLESRREQMEALIADRDVIVRARTLELMLKLSAASRENCGLLEAAGLLELEVTQLLSFEDPLGCLAVWNVLVEFVSGLESADSSSFSIVLNALYPTMENLIDSFTELDEFLKPGLLSCVSAVIGLTYDEQNEHHCILLPKLVSFLTATLQSREVDDWTACVLDAVGLLGKTESCSKTVVLHNEGLMKQVTNYALGAGSTPNDRLIAIHSLSNFCRTSKNNPLTKNDKVQEQIKELILDAGRDDELWDFLHVRLKGPVQDLRPAIYHLIDSLSNHPWFVCGVCANTLLLEYITNPLSESDHQLCNLRFETVKHMNKSVEVWLDENFVNANQRQLLEITLPRLRNSVDSGPYGAGRATNESIPVVATERR
eukprot:g4110.t1